MIYLYFEIGLKPAVFGCLTDIKAPLSVALESCSSPLKYSASLQLKNVFLVLGFRLFVSDVISEVVFWPFGLMLHGLGPYR